LSRAICAFGVSRRDRIRDRDKEVDHGRRRVASRDQEAVKQNEIGDASPFALSYAELDQSGASFGALQGDTNASDLARTTLTEALRKAGADDVRVTRILNLVGRPCPNGNPLNPEDTIFSNDALASADGRVLVDQMDDQLLQVVLRRLDKCLTAAATRNLAIAPIAQLYIAMWSNMTGEPDTLAKFLSGTSELGLPPPRPPTFAEGDIETYLHATKFFTEHPKNFKHFQESAQKGAKLLPGA
jgi:hypothetical protein